MHLGIKKSLIEFFVCFSIGLGAFLQTFSFNNSIALYKYGANCWPAAIALCIMFFSVLLLIDQIFISKKYKKNEDDENAPCSDFSHRLCVYVTPIIFVILMPYIGFYAGILIFLPLYSWMLSRKNIFHIIGICFSISSIIIVIFTRYLFVPFPVGTILGFYEFNSAIVAFLY